MSLKETIERELNIPTHLHLGAPGALDVLLDGKKIYSKKQSGRLPNPEEIVQLIRAQT